MRGDDVQAGLDTCGPLKEGWGSCVAFGRAAGWCQAIGSQLALPAPAFVFFTQQPRPDPQIGRGFTGTRGNRRSSWAWLGRGKVVEIFRFAIRSVCLIWRCVDHVIRGACMGRKTGPGQVCLVSRPPRRLSFVCMYAIRSPPPARLQKSSTKSETTPHPPVFPVCLRPTSRWRQRARMTWAATLCLPANVASAVRRDVGPSPRVALRQQPRQTRL